MPNDNSVIEISSLELIQRLIDDELQFAELIDDMKNVINPENQRLMIALNIINNSSQLRISAFNAIRAELKSIRNKGDCHG